MSKSESIRWICRIGIVSINNWKFHWNLVYSLHDEKSVNTGFEVHFGISLVHNFNHVLSLIVTSCLMLSFSVSASGICSWQIQWVKLKIWISNSKRPKWHCKTQSKVKKHLGELGYFSFRILNKASYFFAWKGKIETRSKIAPCEKSFFQQITCDKDLFRCVHTCCYVKMIWHLLKLSLMF